MGAEPDPVREIRFGRRRASASGKMPDVLVEDMAAGDQRRPSAFRSASGRRRSMALPVFRGDGFADAAADDAPAYSVDLDEGWNNRPRLPRTAPRKGRFQHPSAMMTSGVYDDPVAPPIPQTKPNTNARSVVFLSSTGIPEDADGHPSSAMWAGGAPGWYHDPAYKYEPPPATSASEASGEAVLALDSLGSAARDIWANFIAPRLATATSTQLYGATPEEMLKLPDGASMLAQSTASVVGRSILSRSGSPEQCDRQGTGTPESDAGPAAVELLLNDVWFELFVERQAAHKDPVQAVEDGAAEEAAKMAVGRRVVSAATQLDGGMQLLRGASGALRAVCRPAVLPGRPALALSAAFLRFPGIPLIVACAAVPGLIFDAVRAVRRPEEAFPHVALGAVAIALVLIPLVCTPLVVAIVVRDEHFCPYRAPDLPRVLRAAIPWGVWSDTDPSVAPRMFVPVTTLFRGRMVGAVGVIAILVCLVVVSVLAAWHATLRAEFVATTSVEARAVAFVAVAVLGLLFIGMRPSRRPSDDATICILAVLVAAALVASPWKDGDVGQLSVAALFVCIAGAVLALMQWLVETFTDARHSFAIEPALTAARSQLLQEAAALVLPFLKELTADQYGTDNSMFLHVFSPAPAVAEPAHDGGASADMERIPAVPVGGGEQTAAPPAVVVGDAVAADSELLSAASGSMPRLPRSDEAPEDDFSNFGIALDGDDAAFGDALAESDADAVLAAETDALDALPDVGVVGETPAADSAESEDDTLSNFGIAVPGDFGLVGVDDTALVNYAEASRNAAAAFDDDADMRSSAPGSARPLSSLAGAAVGYDSDGMASVASEAPRDDDINARAAALGEDAETTNSDLLVDSAVQIDAILADFDAGADFDAFEMGTAQRVGGGSTDSTTGNTGIALPSDFALDDDVRVSRDSSAVLSPSGAIVASPAELAEDTANSDVLVDSAVDIDAILADFDASTGFDPFEMGRAQPVVSEPGDPATLNNGARPSNFSRDPSAVLSPTESEVPRVRHGPVLDGSDVMPVGRRTASSPLLPALPASVAGRNRARSVVILGDDEPASPDAALPPFSVLGSSMSRPASPEHRAPAKQRIPSRGKHARRSAPQQAPAEAAFLTASTRDPAALSVAPAVGRHTTATRQPAGQLRAIGARPHMAQVPEASFRDAVVPALDDAGAPPGAPVASSRSDGGTPDGMGKDESPRPTEATPRRRYAWEESATDLSEPAPVSSSSDMSADI